MTFHSLFSLSIKQKQKRSNNSTKPGQEFTCSTFFSTFPCQSSRIGQFSAKIRFASILVKNNFEDEDDLETADFLENGANGFDDCSFIICIPQLIFKNPETVSSILVFERMASIQ